MFPCIFFLLTERWGLLNILLFSFLVTAVAHGIRIVLVGLNSQLWLLKAYAQQRVLKLWFQGHSLSITWDFVRNTISWEPRQIYWIRNSQGRVGSGLSNKPSRWFWSILEFKHHFLKLTGIDKCRPILGSAVSTVNSIMLSAQCLIKYLRNLVMNCPVLSNNVASGLIPTYLVIVHYLLHRECRKQGVSNERQKEDFSSHCYDLSCSANRWQETLTPALRTGKNIKALK